VITWPESLVLRQAQDEAFYCGVPLALTLSLSKGEGVASGLAA
jgi:hypothetical protein